MNYSVNSWFTNPNEDDDGCDTSVDFNTRKEAEDYFNTFEPSRASIIYLELDGPDVYGLRRTKHPLLRKDDDITWRRELAMEAGMMMGIDAYNDVMGQG